MARSEISKAAGCLGGDGFARCGRVGMDLSRIWCRVHAFSSHCTIWPRDVGSLGSESGRFIGPGVDSIYSSFGFGSVWSQEARNCWKRHLFCAACRIQHNDSKGDYRSSWKNQKSFWTQVANLTPDAGEGTLIFAIKEGLPETKYILTHSWADPIILNQVYRFPRSWNQVPRLFVVEADWTDEIMVEGSRLKWRMPRALWLTHWVDLPSGNLILLRMDRGELQRLSGTINIHGIVSI